MTYHRGSEAMNRVRSVLSFVLLLIATSAVAMQSCNCQIGCTIVSDPFPVGAATSIDTCRLYLYASDGIQKSQVGETTVVLASTIADTNRCTPANPPYPSSPTGAFACSVPLGPQTPGTIVSVEMTHVADVTSPAPTKAKAKATPKKKPAKKKATATPRALQESVPTSFQFVADTAAVVAAANCNCTVAGCKMRSDPFPAGAVVDLCVVYPAGAGGSIATAAPVDSTTIPTTNASVCSPATTYTGIAGRKACYVPIPAQPSNPNLGLTLATRNSAGEVQGALYTFNNTAPVTLPPAPTGNVISP